MVPPERIELSTSPLPRVRSTTELWRPGKVRANCHSGIARARVRGEGGGGAGGRQRGTPRGGGRRGNARSGGRGGPDGGRGADGAPRGGGVRCLVGRTSGRGGWPRRCGRACGGARSSSGRGGSPGRSRARTVEGRRPFT